MKKVTDKPIVEGLTVGGGALLISILWVVFGAFHPLIILLIYLVALYCLSISIIWLLAKDNNLRSWFTKRPTRFFVVGFIEVFLIVGFLDIYYLDGLGDVLVEAHGLIFDLFIFGIVLTAYEVIRSKQDKVERYKEELDDYREWKEDEAGYRVAGIIRRLESEGVEDINFDKLNLSKCSKEIVEKAVKTGARIISLQEAKLYGANLQEANLLGANLQEAGLYRANLQEAKLGSANLLGANLLGANLQEADLGSANLQEADLGGANLQEAKLYQANLQEANLRGAKVSHKNWIEGLKDWDVKGWKEIESEYYVDKAPEKDLNNFTYYRIKGKPKGEINNTLNQCTAKTKRGNPCKNKPKAGFNKCYRHVGS